MKQRVVVTNRVPKVIFFLLPSAAAQPLVKSLRFHENVMCLAADDKYIIYGSKDRTAAVHDRRAGKNLKRIQVCAMWFFIFFVWFRFNLGIPAWAIRQLLRSQLNSYLLCMSYSDCEVWAGDITGKLHSFSMRDGTLKAMSQIDVGHTALITGIHRSPGSLYTCSSDRTVKVLFGTLIFFSLLRHFSACCHWMCSRYTSRVGLQGHCAHCSITLQSLGSVSAHIFISFEMLNHWRSMIVKAALSILHIIN